MIKFLMMIAVLAMSLQARQIIVTDASDLMDKMQNAVAGDTIIVPAGEYVGDIALSGDPGNLPNGTGYFWIGNDGTATDPIVVVAQDASNPPVIKGSDMGTGYVIHVTGDYVVLKNLVVTYGDKGVIFDNSSNSIIEDCDVSNVGSELIHVRDGSSDVTISRNKVYNAGNGGNGSIGEGLYIGTDQARWGADDVDQSGWGDKAITEGYGGYDWRVNNTKILCNYLSGSISAEPMDIKEGTQGTIVKSNVVVGDSVGQKAGAASYDDSFIDIKGVSATFNNNKLYRCGNQIIQRYINEVLRDFPHIPANLTVAAHSRPWCDDDSRGVPDGNICFEKTTEIPDGNEMFEDCNHTDPRVETTGDCAEQFVYGSATPVLSDLNNYAQINVSLISSRINIKTKSFLNGLTIDLYDLNGKLVSSLWKGDLASGNHSIQINLDGVDAGVYLVKLQGENLSRNYKVVK